MDTEPHFGLTGLATMGANLARNVAHHGIPVAVHNRTTSRTDKFIAEHGSEGPITGHASVQEWVGALERPRVLMSMVQAGPATDAVIDEIVQHLDPGDIVIDGGNANFRDTQRRHAAAREKGIHFLGVGVSGGEEGALKGPSIMPGGDREPYEASVRPILEAIAAEVDGTPCCTYIGPDGAGHYVKMVHNGIEYADMQLIAESYDLLRHAAGLDVAEIAQVFKGWNDTELESFLIEITATVLAKVDARSGQPLVDVIQDKAGQKGTGRWTAQNALELGIPLTGITEAVFARSLSALKGERSTAAGKLVGPGGGLAAGGVAGGGAADGGAAGSGAAGKPGTDDGLVSDLSHALYASKIVSYAQGFAQMAAASKDEGWNLELGAMATIWRGGCIIRARFLDRIREAYDAEPDLPNLMLSEFFADALAQAQDPWRRVVARSAELGIPAPAFASSLAYYDGYRRERGPANLLQGLRDLFGAHTYERTDRPGAFHTLWGGDGSEIEA